MPINDQLRKIGISATDICMADTVSLQLKLATVLRNAAVEYLRNSEGVVANAFRESYQIVAGVGDHVVAKKQELQAFLKNQSRSGVFGTYIEAAALGELLECNVVVTPVIKKVEQTPFTVHQVDRTNGKEVPTVHLYCADNTHWYTVKDKPNQTIGDGNCLYNGFAQELKKIIIKQMARQEDGPIAHRVRYHGRARMFPARNNEMLHYPHEAKQLRYKR